LRRAHPWRYSEGIMKPKMLIALLAALFALGAAFAAYLLVRPGSCMTCGNVPASSGTTSIRVYFANSRMDPQATCVVAFPVERLVRQSDAIAREALTELLAGPTQAERAEGYFTSIPDGVVLQGLSSSSGELVADFSDTLERGVAGSCRVSEIRTQIEDTLRQFSAGARPVISIDGRTEDILQP
jgi:spore germination protein GerM